MYLKCEGGNKTYIRNGYWRSNVIDYRII